MSTGSVKIIDIMDGYRVSDRFSDAVIFRDEVQKEGKTGSYIAVSDSEWKKFSQSKEVKSRFTVVDRSSLTGKTIVEVLNKNPATLTAIIDEMGGEAYVTLALEDHFSTGKQSRLGAATKTLKSWELEIKVFYEASKAIPPTTLVAQYVSQILCHSDAINVMRSFVPKGALTGDDRIDAVHALKQILSKPKLVELFREIITVQQFIFSQKGLKYSFEKTLTDGLIDGELDCDKFTALAVQLGKAIGLQFDIYAFNDHVTLAVVHDELPSKSLMIESTDGYIVDQENYIASKHFSCLKMGIPISHFKNPSERIIASVFIQEINDLMAKQKPKDALPLMSLVEKLRPDDPSVLMLFQMLLVEAGDVKGAEAYRMKLINLIKKTQQNP